MTSDLYNDILNYCLAYYKGDDLEASFILTRLVLDHGESEVSLALDDAIARRLLVIDGVLTINDNK